jgi:ribosomal protein S17
VRVTGADETVRTLERIATEASLPPRRAAEILAGAIRSEAPIRTGYLAGSVSADEESATVTVGAEYGVYVAARDPFVARGSEAAARDIAQEWERNVGDIIRREGAGP